MKRRDDVEVLLARFVVEQGSLRRLFDGRPGDRLAGLCALDGKLENVERRARIPVCERHDGSQRVVINGDLLAPGRPSEKFEDVIVGQGIQSEYAGPRKER